jgi:AcrR family transcriptional regulator
VLICGVCIVVDRQVDWVNEGGSLAMAKDVYHHGDLRAACVLAALNLLEEEGGTAGLSLRAVARRLGVSPGAPYRHYADRDALISAVAAVGYAELGSEMAARRHEITVPEDFVEAAVAYVLFALRRPALFHVMFGEPCDRDNAERVAATAAIRVYVMKGVSVTFPDADVEATATALWGVMHGLAFLHLDGKLEPVTPTAVSRRVRAALRSILGVSHDLSNKPRARGVGSAARRGGI